MLELVSQGAMLCGGPRGGVAKCAWLGGVCWEGFKLGAVGLGPVGAGLVRTGGGGVEGEEGHAWPTVTAVCVQKAPGQGLSE